MFYIMNTTGIFTTEKNLTVCYSEVTKDEAIEIISTAKYNPISAIGHESTVDIINTLLDTDFRHQRYQVDFKPGDEALCFQVKTRPPEGQVLSKDELEELGYKFTYLEILI